MKALVVFKTPTEIILASDGKELIKDGVAPKGMKISRIGNLYFAHSALTWDSPIGFDILNRAREYLSNEISFEDNLDQIKLVISNELKETYRLWLANWDIKSFWLLGDHVFILATFENTTPKVSAIIFRRTGDESEFDITCDFDHLTEEIECWSTVKAGRFLEANPFLWNADKKEAAIRMIVAEIASDPQTVGFPIYVMTLRPNCEPVFEEIPGE